MRYGVREICNVVLRAKATQYLGNKKFYKNEPVIYFDTLKTSSLEGAATTVYATGGRGNSRLVAWEGERTLTFTMEDALISSESFSILSGAGLMEAGQDKPIYVHTTSQIQLKYDNIIELPESACWNKYPEVPNPLYEEGSEDPDKKYPTMSDPEYHDAADIFIMTMTNGEINAEPCIPNKVADDHKTITCYGHKGTIKAGEVVLVDYYVKRTGGAQLIEITPDKFGGNYYLEAATLFRDQQSGFDMPAEFIIPNCKVQSNFTFSMAATGDPSTFTFIMDAFPDYVKFDNTHKVLAAINVITDAVDSVEDKREACFEQPIENENKGVTLTYDYINNKNLKVTATGTNIQSNYKEEDWGPILGQKGVKMVTVDIDLPTEVGKSYRLVTYSPLHEYYYGTDDRIMKDGNNYYKEQKLDEATSEKWPVRTAISNKKGTIKFELYKTDVENTVGTLVRTITVDNQIKFA